MWSNLWCLQCAFLCTIACEKKIWKNMIYIYIYISVFMCLSKELHKAGRKRCGRNFYGCNAFNSFPLQTFSFEIIWFSFIHLLYIILVLSMSSLAVTLCWFFSQGAFSSLLCFRSGLKSCGLLYGVCNVASLVYISFLLIDCQLQ